MNRPRTLPMDDSSAQKISLKIWLMDEPCGQARDIIFTILSVAPSSNGHPKTLLGLNAHLYGSD